MATGPQFIEALVPVCGMHPSTLVRYFQEIRRAQLIPTSGKGGGKAAVHFSATDAARIVLALCARGPGEAVDTCYSAARLPETSLKTKGAARNLLYELVQTIATGEVPEGWSMVLDSNPLSATITDGTGSTKLFSHSSDSPIPGKRRHIRFCCHVHRDVLALLAELVTGVPA